MEGIKEAIAYITGLAVKAENNRDQRPDILHEGSQTL